MIQELPAYLTAQGRLVFFLLSFLLSGSRTFAQGDGSQDVSFNTVTGSDNSIQKILIQPDGKVLILGTFTTYNGTTSNKMARLNSDGTLDNTFSTGSGVGNKDIQSMALQPDGNILIGGQFSTYNGTSRAHLARLTSTGTLDGTFSPGSGFSNSPEVRAIVLQPDNKIIYGGQWSKFNGVTSAGMIRLNANGSLDNTFTAAAGLFLYSLALQSDGKFVVGIGGGTNITRVTSTGAADATFTPGTGADNVIMAMALQPDGKIIIGGYFLNYNGTARSRIARLNSNGTLDASFNVGTGVNGYVSSIALQSDGKVLIGGSFLAYNGTARNRIARLNSDGSLDTGFNPGSGANDVVNAIALTANDEAVLGGDFTSYNGSTSSRIAQVFSPSSPLPVSWLYFKGNTTEGGNQLSWATATEKDSRDFVIERSLDGVNFGTAGEVKAAGNSNQEIRYTFTDKNATVLGGRTVYYRLKQTDLSGSFEYSKTIVLSKDKFGADQVSVYPNPFSDELQLDLTSALPQTQKVEVTLTNMEGRTVYKTQINSTAEASGIKLNDLPELKAGVYMLKIVSEDKITALKLIRQ